MSLARLRGTPALCVVPLGEQADPTCRMERVKRGSAADIVLVVHPDGTGVRCPCCQTPSTTLVERLSEPPSGPR